MKDLSRYRATENKFDWVDNYIAKWGVDVFAEYYDKVRKALDDLKPGHYYDIREQVPEDKQDVFIKICCSYIWAKNPYFEFSDDFTQIWNRESHNSK